MKIVHGLIINTSGDISILINKSRTTKVKYLRVIFNYED